jgi:hypothetical protein
MLSVTVPRSDAVGSRVAITETTKLAKTSAWAHSLKGRDIARSAVDVEFSV